MNKMNWLICVTLSVGCFSLAAAEADPLFSRMQGHWIGSGTKVYPLSGRSLQLSAEVEASIEGDRLVSKNHVVEFRADASGKPSVIREYDRTYWVKFRDVGGSSRRYEIGSGEGRSQENTIPGVFDRETFDSEQQLGGEPPYYFRSHTEFKGAVTHYLETGWHGDTKITETEITYHSAP